MGPQPSTVEPVQVAEYNQQSVNNIIIREGSPEYMVASADGTESVSQKSGKKRRRWQNSSNINNFLIFNNTIYVCI